MRFKKKNKNKKAPREVLFYFAQKTHELDRALYFASLQAAGANIDTLYRSVYVRTNFLNVREPTAFGQDMGVGNLVPGLRVFPTDFATFCHERAPP